MCYIDDIREQKANMLKAARKDTFLQLQFTKLYRKINATCENVSVILSSSDKVQRDCDLKCTSSQLFVVITIASVPYIPKIHTVVKIELKIDFTSSLSSL